MRIGHAIQRVRDLRSERGAALVEFGLVVPFLMIMMCATIDFGLAVYTLNNLTAAVREGGRFAATIPSPGPVANDSTVRNRVYNYIVGMNNGLTAAQVKSKISVTVPDPATGNITVQITRYPYVPVTPLAPIIGLDTLWLNRKSVFRWEMSSS